MISMYNVPTQNRNKNHKNLILPKYGEKFANITEDMDEEEYMSEIFGGDEEVEENEDGTCLLYTSPSPRD